MSTAQQLGLIGNSIKVQSLPTASAETFGAGNRYYTLIGQQEGYITGHTYHTVVANDVYSWEDVAGGDYNMLDNIPVINQDLTASDFTPVANTYYRHTGTTTNTFIQGVIYCYDGTEYKALDGSGSGGTTLNRYELSIPADSLRSNSLLLYKIYTQAKGRVSICSYSYKSSSDFEYVEYTPYLISKQNIRLFYVNGQQGSIYIQAGSNSYGTAKYDYAVIENDKTISSAGSTSWTITLKVIYYNDTEITA